MENRGKHNLITKYLEFIKESKKNDYDYGCVLTYLDFIDWEDIINQIDEDDLYTGETYGKVKTPHLTYLYGYEDTKIDEVKEKLDELNLKPFQIETDAIDLFESENYDVVKFNVKKSKLLQSIFDKLSELPNKNLFKNYSPHITIAYVKKGLGKKYLNSIDYTVIKMINEISYIEKGGKEHIIKL